ncbi:putative alkyl quinolones biosynthesis protein PqsC [Pseudoalteromonas citrea]|uniref:Alkyl quinolones biosynthesis protein PqsC n=2 Tax=Pseudoalteromonas citrea TaxID=43655 RepID=A0AAD4AGN0_9GAMM|nr:3-oxoacyl-ACP synthase III family protein [Pseudoalteromonas citrea]KAF7767812.1 putative alkyl quinolones biosynthesis protein PqsC [Pseudoalteromonas citrea]
MTCGVTIRAIATRVPTISVGNFDEKWFPDIDKQSKLAWQEKWGIEQRFYTDECKHSPMTLACDAAREAMGLAEVNYNDIDLLITSSTNAIQRAQNTVCGLPKNLFYPRISYAIKRVLGLDNAMEFDIQNECSSMMDAMQVGHNAIKTGQAKKVLLIVQESTHEVMDRTNVNGMNFGDGYAAIILSHDDDPALGIQSQAYQSFSKNYDLATVSWDKQVNTPSHMSFQMADSGAGEMGKFVPKYLPKLVKRALVKAELSNADIDFYVFHQPARKLIDAWCALLNVPPEKTLKIMQQYGCAVSAAMPIAFNLALQQHLIPENSKIIIASPSVGWGFGAQVWQLGALPKYAPEIHQSVLETGNHSKKDVL